ncbi:class I SAM-dependent methyltransferase [Polaromonas sp. YR568]|uniref:class I SAM-dependent methyltransferase n=1 Tax=Polaromonas sp. YR568 TaxID=1855301 RepID=UPI003137B288
MPRASPRFAGLCSDIERYYTAKIGLYGTSPLGVDWSCEPTQKLRFIQVLKVCDFDSPFSLADLGCGYGALLGFLAERFHDKQVRYKGIDLSPAMIVQASRLWGRRTDTEFTVGNELSGLSDYTVASGIFNVKLHQPEIRWRRFVQATLAHMHAHSRRGFAVNFLAPLTDTEKTRPELYRAEPELWCDYCERALGADVTLLTGYGMREYTLLVRHRASLPAR